MKSFNEISQIHSVPQTHESSEDLSNQIDRINKALEVVMHEIETSGCSRNPSRVSIIHSDIYQDDSSESSFDEINYSSIEKLLQRLDRQQMVIEDLFSEEKRRTLHPEPKERCGHDINRIRKEVWLQVKMQKNEQNERERKKFEEKLELLDSMQEEYTEKRRDLVGGIDKLKIKEKLLLEKEKCLLLREQDIRNQRLWMDRIKNEWEQERKMKNNNVEVSHSRHSSFSHLPKIDVPVEGRNDGEGCIADGKNNEYLGEKFEQNALVQRNHVEERKNSNAGNRMEQLKNMQNEIKRLEEARSKISGNDMLEIDIKIESLKGKLANIRGEIAISESCKATRLMSSMMMSIKNEVSRDEKNKRLELIQAANKNLSTIKPKPQELQSKPKETKPIVKEENHTENDAPVPKGLI